MATIRILVLTDDDGSYTETDRFGLTELVNTLRTANEPGLTYEVTTAHRLGGPTTSPSWPQAAHADIKGFLFTEHFDPNRYDEVWFFGVGNGSSPQPAPLMAAEIAVVARFMQAGGGVFATGDHEDLGAQLCGQLPRVRNMRKWHFDYSAVTGTHTYDDYDPNSGNAPPLFGKYRHDTLVAGHDQTTYSFDDQSDDVPQTISLMRYTFRGGSVRSSYPHPLLCSPQGEIAVLPDHMHEGECVVPAAADLPQLTFNLDGQSVREYPDGFGGTPAPELIAWGSTRAGHITTVPNYPDSMDPPVVAATFGVVAAYDGHLANVGRVVTGSTFHHYFNINLTGTMETSDPTKRKGFSASEEGKAAYEMIKTYYRNLARWLVPDRPARAMWRDVFVRMTDDAELRMSLHPQHIERLGWPDQIRFGMAVRNALSRRLGSCVTFEIIATVIDRLWLLCPRLALLKTLPDPPPWDRYGVVDREAMAAVAAGAIYEQVLLALGGVRADADTVLDAEPDVLFGRAGDIAVERIGSGLAAQIEATQAFAEQLRSV